MVLLQERSQAPSRITLQTSEITADTTVIRSLDWDRDLFDIEFELQNGTTYNSFILRGDKTTVQVAGIGIQTRILRSPLS
jgi:hypothetical protein